MRPAIFVQVRALLHCIALAYHCTDSTGEIINQRFKAQTSACDGAGSVCLLLPSTPWGGITALIYVHGATEQGSAFNAAPRLRLTPVKYLLINSGRRGRAGSQQGEGTGKEPSPHQVPRVPPWGATTAAVPPAVPGAGGSRLSAAALRVPWFPLCWPHAAAVPVPIGLGSPQGSRG